MTDRSIHAPFAVKQVTVASTGGGTEIVPAKAGRKRVRIRQLGTIVVWLGKSGVTTTTGYNLPGTAGSEVTIETTEAIQGLAASTTQAVAVIEEF